MFFLKRKPNYDFKVCAHDDKLWSLSHSKRIELFQDKFKRSFRSIERKFSSKEGDFSYYPFIQHKCIFIHIPKSGGNSISQSIFGRICGGHDTIRKYSIAFNEDEFNDFFKFTFVRNPWGRLLSAYMFLKSGGFNDNDALWFKKNLSKYDSFDDFVKEWVNKKNIYKYIHFKPQYGFLCISSLTPDVDFIGKLENIDRDFKFIANKIGRKGLSLPHLNKTKSDRNKASQYYYSPESVEIVRKVYSEDIEIFGYVF